MKFTLGWLKEHLETKASLDEISDTLTMIGLEVEEVIDRAKGLDGFVTAQVREATRHPNADKLQICKVDTGEEIFDVVCGAPNARAGMKGVFAREGQYVPGIDMTLGKANIRGVESNGMLLSEHEMGLGDNYDGIIELPSDSPLGARAVDIMGLGDPVIEIAITPNRGDCLGVRGVARDLAAAGIGALKPLNASAVAGTFESPVKVHLDFNPEASDACPYFVGRYIRGVKNGQSPQWLKDRLLAVGLRPISALVDITNLMTIDLCRPLHVFDADKIHSDIHVRLANNGEKLPALDGKDYEMDSAMTVIADKESPKALAGIMGGAESSCTEKTTNVFLEVAYFDPTRTAATGRKLNLQSDARYRFERGVDPAFLADAAEIATQLILDLCGGEVSELTTAGAKPDWKRSYTLRPEYAYTLGGLELESSEQERILLALGCELKKDGDAFDVAVPSWRPDIVGQADLVEEILRLHGYGKIPAVPLERETTLPHPALDAEQRTRTQVRRELASCGLTEAVTYSFLSGAQAEIFKHAGDEVCLANPISSDLSVMRPSILPNLIAAAGRNAGRGIQDAAFFEIGPQFTSDEAKGQATVAAGLRSGRTGCRNWAQPPRAVDAFDAKSDALSALAAAGAPIGSLQTVAEAPAWFHPGRSGELRLGPKNVLARFGEIHPQALKRMGVKGPMVGFEVLLDNLPKPKSKKSAAKPPLKLSPFQPLERDFAFVLDSKITAESVVRAVKGSEKNLITDVRVFDLFEGKSLDQGQKSMAVNVVLQPTDKTLTDADIEAVAEKVVAAVGKATGGKLRA